MDNETSIEAEADLQAYAAETADVVLNFAQQHDLPNLVPEFQAWLRQDDRDFYYVNVNGLKLLATRYGNDGDGIDVWLVKTLKNAHLPSQAVALAAAKMVRGPVPVGPLKVPVDQMGPEACLQCRIRQGLGTCSSCLSRDAAGELPGHRDWVRAVSDLLENRKYLEAGDREMLLRWLAGWD